MKPIDETNNANEHKMVKIPTGRRQTSLLFTSVAEELNSGLPRKNSSLVVRTGLELVTSGFQFRHQNHSLKLCPGREKTKKALVIVA